MQLPLGASESTTAITVSQLTRRVRDTLEEQLDEVWVVGEISNFRVPSSRHFYFSLKDERSQVAAVMFRSRNQGLPFAPEDGMQVVVRGRVGIYEVRGSLQLYVEAMEPRGQGSLQLAFEQLKNRLANEGLFAEERKRSLPFVPRCVAIITALTGAAIHDMLTTLRARWPGLHIVVCPVRVQGAGAADEIARAIADANQLADVQVIITGRGGGSLEDLWAFNEETVARAIAASAVPVVSAVGHETDFTIADLVADRRAPTPTAAATIVVPDRRELQAQLRRATEALQAATRRRIEEHRKRLAAHAALVRDPRAMLRTLRLRIDELGDRALRSAGNTLRGNRERVQAGAQHLNALSPLAVLQRGYSIARRADTRDVVRDGTTLNTGDRLDLTFAQGSARVRVEP
jgi:exodeoxyribonuclease VII large subunit